MNQHCFNRSLEKRFFCVVAVLSLVEWISQKRWIYLWNDDVSGQTATFRRIGALMPAGGTFARFICSLVVVRKQVQGCRSVHMWCVQTHGGKRAYMWCSCDFGTITILTRFFILYFILLIDLIDLIEFHWCDQPSMILINKKNWLLLLYYYLAACAMFVLSIVGRYFSFIVYSIRLAPRTDTNISDFVCLCALCSHCQIGIGLCKDHREININIHSDCNDHRSCWKIGLYNLITVYVRRCGLRLKLLSAHFPCILLYEHMLCGGSFFHLVLFRI